MRTLISLIAIIYLIDFFVIRRAKRGKRTIIPLLIVGALSILWGSLCYLGMFENTDFSAGVSVLLINTIFVLNIIVIIFISDYIANKHKK